MIKRSANSTCLLCYRAKATKKGSHIIPKMLTKRLFESGVQAVVLNSPFKNRAHRVTQDSFKEDYLFCPRCEIRLSRVETYIGRELLEKYKSESYKDDFTISLVSYTGITKEAEIMYLKKVEIGMLRLFAYSIMWRSFICSHKEFEHVRYNPRHREILRKELDTYLADTEKDVLDNCSRIYSHTEPSFLFSMNTCLDAKPEDMRYIYAFGFDIPNERHQVCLVAAASFVFTFYINSYPFPYKIETGYNSRGLYPELSLSSLQRWSDFYKESDKLFLDAKYPAIGRVK